MNVLIGSFFTLLFLAIALDSQGAGRFDELDVLEPVIANGTVIGNPNDPIARSTVLILGVERSGHNGISYNGGSICTGTIISPALVVTAAHCVVEDDTETPMSPSSLLVEMALFYDGESPLPRPSSVRVSSVRRHPGYRNRGAKNDIALIRLAGPIKPGYRPANVISQSQSLQEGKSVVVAGYGATSLTSNPSSFRLRFFEY